MVSTRLNIVTSIGYECIPNSSLTVYHPPNTESFWYSSPCAIGWKGVWRCWQPSRFSYVSCFESTMGPAERRTCSNWIESENLSQIFQSVHMATHENSSRISRRLRTTHGTGCILSCSSLFRKTSWSGQLQPTSPWEKMEIALDREIDNVQGAILHSYSLKKYFESSLSTTESPAHSVRLSQYSYWRMWEIPRATPEPPRMQSLWNQYTSCHQAHWIDQRSQRYSIGPPISSPLVPLPGLR